VSTEQHGVVKVRLMRHEHRAARVGVITAALADARVPALLARTGATTVERWVDGAVLGPGRVAAAELAAAADILVMLHGFGGLANERLPRRQRLGPVIATARRHVGELANGAISRRDAGALAGILDGLPDDAAWGLTHTDFGGDNLVLRPDGTLVSIDNEHLVRGFLDFDVARAWYRWPMPEPSWRRFVRRYEVGAGRTVAATELRAWRALATLTGVRRRFRVGAPLAGALDRLRDVLDG
jgi:hypothetical protein